VNLGRERERPVAGGRRPHHGRAEAWGILDQGLVSFVNFLTIILVARSVAPSDFGFFVLAFTVLQSAGTLQAALITRPHNVLGAVRQGREYVDFSTTTALAQIGFTAVLALLTAIVAGLAWAAGFSHAGVFLALVPALVAWQLQELGRRILYTERRLRAAFAADLLAYGAQAVVLVVLWQRDELTASSALLALAATFAVGAAALAWRLRRILGGRAEAEALSAGWRFGKWLGVAEVGQWFSTQFYVYLAGAVLGVVASGALKAGQTLLGPMSVFLSFVTSYLPVVLAQDLQSTGTIYAATRRRLRAILPFVVGYCVLVAVFAAPLLGLVYGSSYEEYADVVRLFALYYVLLAFSTVAIAALSARETTRDVFLGQAAGAVVSVAIGWLLLRELGPAGGVAGMIVSWAVAMAFFVRALRGDVSTAKPRERAGPHAATEPSDTV
jgi:O-antigen/teichoic acid export membrane protein